MKIVVFTEEELDAFVNSIIDKYEKIQRKLQIEKESITVKQPVSFVDTEDYGKETGKHPITIRRWIHKGLLTGYKVGGRLMIDREEANALIREKKVVIRQFPEA